jgi:NAD-dependent deacetylase
MFGEVLPEAAMARAESLCRKTRLLLVLGSSLEVWPVAGLPIESRSFAVVNRGPTALDDRATLVLDGGAGETLAALAAALEP